MIAMATAAHVHFVPPMNFARFFLFYVYFGGFAFNHS